MATFMVVLMVPVFMGVLVDVTASLMGMLVPVMAMGTTFVAMLVLMLVLGVATHRDSSSSFLYIIYL